MKEPIRIAQVLNRMDSGGIEMILMNYYRNMDHEKVQFDFYYANDSDFIQKKEMRRLGAGIYPIPDYTKPLAFHRTLYRALKERKYQIVHVHMNTMSVFALFAAWRAGVPVRICHNHSTAHWSEGKVTLLKFMLRPLNRLFANRYYACGKTAGTWMYGRSCLDSGKVTIIPNAIDTKRFAYDAGERRHLREELGIDEKAFVVGHVGRFRHQKNHCFLLHVFKDVLRQNPRAVLLLIGDGKKQEEIQQLAGSLEITQQVIFAGVRDDVNKLYSVMDVFCLPSYYEGMPLVAWEAQCNGLACLFSDQVTQEAALGPNAQFISLKDTNAWIDAILKAKRDDAGIAEQIDIALHSKKLEGLYLAENIKCMKDAGKYEENCDQRTAV